MVRTEKNGHIWTVIHSRFDEARNAMDPESADALVEHLLAFDTGTQRRELPFCGAKAELSAPAWT